MALPEQHTPKQREFPGTAPETTEEAPAGSTDSAGMILMVFFFLLTPILMLVAAGTKTEHPTPTPRVRFVEYMSGLTPESVVFVEARLRSRPGSKNSFRGGAVGVFNLDVVGSGLIAHDGSEASQERPGYRGFRCPYMQNPLLESYQRLCHHSFIHDNRDKAFRVGYVAPEGDVGRFPNQFFVVYLAELSEDGSAGKEMLSFDQAQAAYIKQFCPGGDCSRLPHPGPSR